MPQMSSRERILAVLDHREPDRLPIDFGGRLTTVHAYTHRDLKEYLHLDGDEEHIRDHHTYLVDPDPRLIERFGRDTIPFMARPGSGWTLQIDPTTNSYLDEWGVKFHMPPDGYYFDIAESPMVDAETAEDAWKYRWPDPRDPARMEGVTEAVHAAYLKGDQAIMMSGPRIGLWGMPWYLRGVQQAFMDLAGNQPLAEALAERYLEWMMDYWDAVLGQVGEWVDLVHVEGDLGGTEGPLFSPAIFKRIYKPRLAKLIAHIKARTRARLFFHSCGSVYWAIPDLIECGVDVLNPVQVNAVDMDTARLKREFGRDLVFWGGGCDPVVLAEGTLEDVENEVHRRIDDLAPGGGYVFGSVHNIQPHVPPRNIVAMFEAAQRYGGW